MESWIFCGGGGRGGGGEGGPGIGEVDGVVDHFLTALEGIDKLGFLGDGGNGVEEELADVGEGGGVTLGNALLGEGGEDLAENVVDVGGGQEVSGEGSSELGAESLGIAELLLVAGMEEAEGRMAGGAKHAAKATVGERELAERRGIGFRAFCSHGYVLVRADFDAGL